MKKTLAFLMALMLVLMSVPAMADGLAITGTEILFAKNGQNSWSAKTEHNVAQKLVEFQLNENAQIYASVYNTKTGELYTGIENAAYEAGKVTLLWNGVNSKGWHPAKGDHVDLTVRILATNENGSTMVDVPFSFYSAHDMENHSMTVIPEHAEDEIPEDVRPGNVPLGNEGEVAIACDHVWYNHNTICVAGIEFRQVRSDLTNKWYNFAAIDLTNDGVQKFDLVASNLFVIGSVTVTKNGDEVIVDWKLNRQGTNDANFQSEREFLTFFSDLNAVTEVEPSSFDGVTYEFGQPISIANDLNGDTNVLLYICNQATYCDNLSYAYLNPIYHARYWPNLPSRVAMRNAMMELVNADLAE